MRILLTGRNGQVGFELQRALSPLGEIVAVGRRECDLADSDGLRALIRKNQPDIVVNAAAYTAVDKAESELAEAFAVNGTAPGVLAEEAAERKALFIHYCTDYVYDGSSTDWYREDDKPNPLNVYGASKLEGSRAIERAAVNHLIFRTSWVFSAHGANFVKTILRLAAEREQLNIVADQVGAPTSAALIADVTAQIVGQYRRTGGAGFPYGLYHLAATGTTTWYDFSQTIVSTALRAGKVLRLKPDTMYPVSSAEYPLPAARPANSRLSTMKLRQTFGLHLPPWQNGLDHVLQQIL
ncbi:MAG: dTDP-4-dehydrorhamnose reductase [Desulfobulbus sp.]|nr:dTDP-4-dehydrorhamnose reductase [Desulfobulbus sp.]